LTKILQNENPPNVTLAKAAELSPIFLKNCNTVVGKICENIEDNFPSRVGTIKNIIQVRICVENTLEKLVDIQRSGGSLSKCVHLNKLFPRIFFPVQN
jgi:hypothetical protein